MKPCPIVVPEPVRVVPSADPHCLTQPPDDPPPVIRALAIFPPGVAGTRAQQDQLADYTVALWKYATRAWRECGPKGTP